MNSIFSGASISNRGGRSHNEDSTLSLTNGATYCWIVADGLGGHSGGEEASRIACETVGKSFQSDFKVSSDSMHKHLKSADDALRREQETHPELVQMKSTIVVLIANAAQAVVGHVGDSRFYYFRDWTLVGQTKDHSVPQSLVDAGELSPSAIRHHEDRNRLLRALGEERPVRSSVFSTALDIGKGDAFLLCTDGFWENVLEVEMELDLCKSRTTVEWLSHMESRLQTRVAGNYDNYTAVAVRGESLPPHTSCQLPQKDKVIKATRSVGWTHSLLSLAVYIILPVSIMTLTLRVTPINWKLVQHAVSRLRDTFRSHKPQ
jgi:serine/threonine protein phosphatase PrpC